MNEKFMYNENHGSSLLCIGGHGQNKIINIIFSTIFNPNLQLDTEEFAIIPIFIFKVNYKYIIHKVSHLLYK